MKGFNSPNMNFNNNNNVTTQNYTITKTDNGVTTFSTKGNGNGFQNPADFFKNDFFNNDFFTNAMNQQLGMNGMNGMNALIPNNKNKNVTTTVTTDKNGKTVTNVVQVYHNIQNNNIHNNITNRITINISLKGLFTDEEIYEYMREQEEREKAEREYEEYLESLRNEERKRRGMFVRESIEKDDEEEGEKEKFGDEVPKMKSKRGRKRKE